MSPLAGETPGDLLYSREHEWLRVEGNRGTVGISDYAQGQLGDVVFVDLPAEGQEVTAGKPMAAVESVKSVSDVYAPVSGRVLRVNEELRQRPELVNEDPYGRGWMVELEMRDRAELGSLLKAEEYRRLVGD